MRKLFLIMITVLTCAWCQTLNARTIHGTVFDETNGEPLIGATIMPVGGGQGTAADIDGNFTLTVPDNVTKVTVSYVGYASRTVTLSDGMKVNLVSSAESLDDVVVVAYGTANKESLTGSVAVVGSKEIEDRPITSVTAALEGNAPGVQVNNTVGSPGSAPSIVIRGFNTINGSASPLYIVDGVEFTGSIADLNPNDIESMSVLKDAASSALYGAKGANGVILITTKRAKNVGKIDVTLSMSQGMYGLGLPLYDRLDANDWMQATFDGLVNGRMSQGLAVDRAAAINYYRQNYVDLFSMLNIYDVEDTALFDEAGKFVGGNPRSCYWDRDWWKSVSQTGHRQDYNINASAASDKYNIFASVGYLKENGYLLRTDFERFSGRINANFQPTSYFRFGVNLSATAQESDYNANAGDSSVENPFTVLSTAPIYPYYAHNADGSMVYDEAGNPVWNTNEYMPNDYLRGSNPPLSLRLNKSNTSVTSVDANLYGTAIIPYGFELTVRGKMYRSKDITKEYMNNIFGSALASNGAFAEGVAHYRSHQFMQTLTWTHDYGAHHVDALLDHENYNVESESMSLYNVNQAFPNIFNVNNFSENMSTGGSAAQQRSESYLGRARYNYDQKYFGEVSVRRDGSSCFSKKNRWGTFWSVGASWIISREKFMQNLEWMDYLKLRAAYGSVGNNASAGSYAYYQLFGMDNQFNDLPALYPSQIAAEDIRWEATKTLDVGLEGSLWNSRFNFSVGYFLKRNSDLLMRVTLPSSAGSLAWSGSNPGITRNVGTMQNYGFELSFGADLIRTRDLRWSASIDATFIRNKIVSLPNGKDILSGNRILTEGRSLYEFYIPRYAGVDQLTGQALYEINRSSHEFANMSQEEGDKAYNNRILKAQENDMLVKIGDRYYSSSATYATKEFCGSSLPVVYGSFGTNLSWRGLNVGLLFTYSLGGKTLDSNYQGYMGFNGTPTSLHKDVLNSWTAAPEGMTADSPNRIDPEGIPQINALYSTDNNATSSRWLTKSDYLVLKNIQITYDLPQKWVRPLQLQNINLGASIDNLFTVTARRGMNPQQSWSGSQATYFGTARVFSFLLTAKF